MIKLEKNEKLPSMRHEAGVTVRLDFESLKELNSISLYEREKRAIVLRKIIIDKIKVYSQNPAYKRFKKDLESKMEAKMEARRKTEEF